MIIFVTGPLSRILKKANALFNMELKKSPIAEKLAANAASGPLSLSKRYFIDQTLTLTLTLTLSAISS